MNKDFPKTTGAWEIVRSKATWSKAAAMGCM